MTRHQDKPAEQPPGRFLCVCVGSSVSECLQWRSREGIGDLNLGICCVICCENGTASRRSPIVAGRTDFVHGLLMSHGLSVGERFYEDQYLRMRWIASIWVAFCRQSPAGGLFSDPDQPVNFQTKWSKWDYFVLLLYLRLIWTDFQPIMCCLF